jgi:hypothetical protein
LFDHPFQRGGKGRVRTAWVIALAIERQVAPAMDPDVAGEPSALLPRAKVAVMSSSPLKYFAESRFKYTCAWLRNAPRLPLDGPR